MSERSSKGFFGRKAKKEKKKKQDRKWNILDILHIGPLKLSRKKKSKSGSRSMSQEPINSKERASIPLNPILKHVVPRSETFSSAKEIQSSAAVPSKRNAVSDRKTLESDKQERSSSLKSARSPDAKTAKSIPHQTQTAREVSRMPALERSGRANPISEEPHSAKEPTESHDEDTDENMKKIDVIEGEMRQCEKQLASTKQQSRELIQRLDKMNREIDELDFIIAKVESSLEAKMEAHETALEQLEKSQFQSIQDAGEQIDKIEDVSKDVNFQVDEMTADADEHLWYLYNPIHATIDLLLHVAIALILWMFKVIVSQAGYQFETSEDSMRAVIDVVSPEDRDEVPHTVEGKRRSRKCRGGSCREK